MSVKEKIQVYKRALEIAKRMRRNYVSQAMVSMAKEEIEKENKKKV
jgi:Cdc6-like AAA superfamily ATPase